MIFVNYEVCNGCGECVSVCSTGAMILQNNHAFIDQELCQGCEICVETCPQGTILVREPVPTGSRVIKVVSAAPAKIAAVPEQPHHTHLQNTVLPAIGSALLWTGKEVIPRLANLALDFLDRQLQSPETDRYNPNVKLRNRRTTHSKWNGRRRRQRQQRKGKFR
jgi:Fe-S-cluster-containing hydrogenase component 2